MGVIRPSRWTTLEIPRRHAKPRTSYPPGSRSPWIPVRPRPRATLLERLAALRARREFVRVHTPALCPAHAISPGPATDVLVGYGWKCDGITGCYPRFDGRNRSGSKTYVLGNIAYTKNNGKEILSIDNRSIWGRELKPGDDNTSGWRARF